MFTVTDTPLPDKVKARITLAPNGCWEWNGPLTSAGYPKINRIVAGRREHFAHRFVYVVLVGPIPQGLEIDHRCYNRRRVNPTHLEAVSHAENAARGHWHEIDTPKRASCRNGHAWTEKSTYRRTDGRRECLICRRARAVEHKRNVRASIASRNGRGAK